MPRANPHSAAALGPVRLGPTEADEKQIITRMIHDALRSDQERTGWFDRQKALSALRYGLRPKRKDWPFVNASNLSIPLIDSTIRKYNPLMMRLVVEADPVVEFVGEDPAAVDAEREAEELYNWLFKTEMDAVDPLAYVIDYRSHRGFSFAQVCWDYRTELTTRVINAAELFPGGLPPDDTAISQLLIQQFDLDLNNPRIARTLADTISRLRSGEEWVKIAYRRVIRDRPQVVDIDPVQVILPSRATNVADAEWVVIQHVLSIRRLKQMEADGFFPSGAVSRILKDMAHSKTRERRDTELTGADTIEFTQGMRTFRDIEDRRTQVWGEEDDDNILIWQLFHWHDIDGDGLLDRVETWIHPRSASKLVSKPYAYPFARWPLVKYDFEKTSRRWHSPRGISAMLEGIQRETNAQHNARIDAMTLHNAPVYQIPAIAGFKARNYRIVPGTIIQTPPGGRLEPLLSDRSAFPEQVAEEQQLRSIAEQYVGTFDAVLASQAGVTKARTATEVQAATQFAASTATFDAILFQLSMRELHEMIWQLWLDLGPPEVHIRVVGEQSTPTTKLIRKADVDRNFKLIPTGTIANTNRALELSHAREALQLYLNDQTGFINPFELRKWHFRLLDYRQARRILNSPDQAAELQTLRQAAAEIQNNPELQAALSGGVFNVPPEEVQRQQTEQLPRNPADRF